MIVNSHCLDAYRNRRSKSYRGWRETLGTHVALSELEIVSGFCETFLEIYRSEILREAATMDCVTDMSVSKKERSRM